MSHFLKAIQLPSSSPNNLSPYTFTSSTFPPFSLLQVALSHQALQLREPPLQAPPEHSFSFLYLGSPSIGAEWHQNHPFESPQRLLPGVLPMPPEW
jgi:hypothetical protein